MGNPLSFVPRTPPVQKWLDNWSAGDSAKRRSSYDEYLKQKAIWQAETKARGTKPNDLSQVMATAFVLAYEAYTGRRASETGYKKMVEEFRTGFRKDAGLRTASNDRKNEIAEDAMLGATDAVMRRRGGQIATDPDRIAKAKEVSGKFLDRWWDEKREGAVALLDAKGSAPAAKPGKGPTFAQALKMTSFKRVAPTVLPESLGKNLPQKENRAMAEKVSRQVLQDVRQGLQKNGAGDVPVDNVARGFTYALMMLHTVALSSPGKPLGEGVSILERDQVVALRKRLAIGLAARPEMRTMSDREKQELTETLYFLPAFTEMLYQAGLKQGDTKAQTAACDTARQIFQTYFGMAPEAFRFH
ncbi:hypothetical protein EON81_10610 [bacterium]|nr:MAG: hypothetical protein EON81_10610 [bacterium]